VRDFELPEPRPYCEVRIREGTYGGPTFRRRKNTQRAKAIKIEKKGQRNPYLSCPQLKREREKFNWKQSKDENKQRRRERDVQEESSPSVKGSQL